MLEKFVAEIEAIRLDVEMMDIELFRIDVKLHSHETFCYGEPLELDIEGGRGIPFASVFEYIQEEVIDVDALIYFNDGEGDFPEEPYYPVLWALSKSCEVSFGEAIIIE